MAGMTARAAGVYLNARRLAAKVKLIALDNVNAVPHKVAIRSIVTAFVGDSKVTKSEIEQALLSIEAAVKGFHTMKGLRAWASEENLALKRSALALIAELQEKIGEGA